ncbi:MAG: RNA pseudouridine synthase [Bacteroidales bacterium]|nr:RNA pseudouridine synthase [Candidatus Liminaster caballi]
MQIIYEDNHLLIVSKTCHEIVQGDKTGDEPLPETLKRFIKERDQKPGNVFLGVTHRLDRPTTGVVIFAKTSKALERMNRMFAEGEVHKTYWAIVSLPQSSTAGSANGVLGGIAEEADLTHWLVRNEKQNRSYAYDTLAEAMRHAPQKECKEARLHYRLIGQSERYALLEVRLFTGRHHQIRCQLSHIGLTIKGDLKYGAKRSNPDGGISLHSRHTEFVHPVSKEQISVTAPVPDDVLWKALAPV